MNPKKLLSLALSSLMAFSGAFCCKAGDPEPPLYMTIHGGFRVVYDNICDLKIKMDKLQEEIDSLQAKKREIDSLQAEIQSSSNIPMDFMDAYLCRVFVYNVLCYRLYDSYRRVRDIRDCAPESVKLVISGLCPDLDDLCQPARFTKNDVKRAQSCKDDDPMDMLNDHPIPEQYL